MIEVLVRGVSLDEEITEPRRPDFDHRASILFDMRQTSEFLRGSGESDLKWSELS